MLRRKNFLFLIYTKIVLLTDKEEENGKRKVHLAC